MSNTLPTFASAFRAFLVVQVGCCRTGSCIIDCFPFWIYRMYVGNGYVPISEEVLASHQRTTPISHVSRTFHRDLNVVDAFQLQGKTEDYLDAAAQRAYRMSQNVFFRTRTFSCPLSKWSLLCIKCTSPSQR